MGTRVKKNHHTEKCRQVLKKNAVSRHRPDKTEQGSYRIIGGHWRSRRLTFPAIAGLRPTTDRVRETLFNWLASDIQGARVLDLFAGSGALGIEALSRGASALLSIEKDKHACAALKSNIELLLPDTAAQQAIHIRCDDALVFLNASRAQSDQSVMPYNLVFLDPPFRKGLLEQALELLAHHPLIAESALIYVEREKEANSLLLPKNWHLIKEKVAGQVRYQLFRHDD
jgi:16S rRNA (guanine966-N2)-methyltransferase